MLERRCAHLLDHGARFDAEDFELHFDPGKLDPPEELHIAHEGLRLGLRT